MQKFLRIGQARARFGVPENTLRFWLSNGTIPRHKLGRATLIDEQDLLDKMNSDTKKAAKKASR